MEEELSYPLHVPKYRAAHMLKNRTATKCLTFLSRFNYTVKKICRNVNDNLFLFSL